MNPSHTCTPTRLALVRLVVFSVLYIRTFRVVLLIPIIEPCLSLNSSGIIKYGLFCTQGVTMSFQLSLKVINSQQFLKHANLLNWILISYDHVLLGKMRTNKFSECENGTWPYFYYLISSCVLFCKIHVKNTSEFNTTENV